MPMASVVEGGSAEPKARHAQCGGRRLYRSRRFMALSMTEDAKERRRLAREAPPDRPRRPNSDSAGADARSRP